VANAHVLTYECWQNVSSNAGQGRQQGPASSGESLVLVNAHVLTVKVWQVFSSTGGPRRQQGQASSGEAP
jgi:hypothetical protein